MTSLNLSNGEREVLVEHCNHPAYLQGKYPGMVAFGPSSVLNALRNRVYTGQPLRSQHEIAARWWDYQVCVTLQL